MNKLKLVNLYGKITNLYVGVDLAMSGDVTGFNHYSESFLSITRKDVDDAFDIFIRPLQDDIWEMIASMQQLVKEVQGSSMKSIKNFILGDVEFGNLHIMIGRLIAM